MQKIIHKKVSLTVGIPVYNEQENIGRLLGDLFAQKQKTFRLESILVISDGSTDDSVRLVRSSKDPRVWVVDYKSRKGKSRRLNDMHSRCKSDVLVTLDADIRIKDKDFLEKLIRPIRQGKADLVCCRIREFAGKGFFEEMINVSNRLKRDIFESYRNGINIYTCRGPVRALSRRLFTRLKYPEVYCEDMYTFLYCQREGYTYYYSRETEAFYKSPANLPDHLRQSNRFSKSKNILEKYFGKKIVASSLRIPVGMSLKYAASEFMRHPIYMAGYLTVLVYTRLVNALAKTPTVKWEMVTSSKKLDKI